MMTADRQRDVASPMHVNPFDSPKKINSIEALNDHLPYFLQSSDNLGAIIIADNLIDEDNYQAWAKNVSLFLVSRRKLGFIDGMYERPNHTSFEEFEVWKMVIGLVLSWILHSVDKTIASTLTYTDSAFVALTDLKERYFQGSEPLIFQLRCALNNIHQGTVSVSFYFNKLKLL